jgi:hypothetical protein
MIYTVAVSFSDGTEWLRGGSVEWLGAFVADVLSQDPAATITITPYQAVGR